MLWLRGSLIGQVVFWWAGFLILTIAGKRLELSRFLRLPKRTTLLFGGAVALFVVGLLLALLWFVLGIRLASVGMIALAAWLLRYDIARRRIKAGGQARYIALALLSGYFWLGIGGYLAGPYYEKGVEAGVSADPAHRQEAIMRGFEIVNSMPYSIATTLVDHPIACNDCHDPASMQLRITRPGFLNGIKALAQSDAAVPQLPSIERWRQLGKEGDYDPNTMASRQEMRSFVCASVMLSIISRAAKSS